MSPNQGGNNSSSITAGTPPELHQNTTGTPSEHRRNTAGRPRDAGALLDARVTSKFCPTSK
ncbi:hypothetical protein IEQ34_005685 [Dendrobium chrysotoxum]|uniref:Uncharacterized protein n=1 Tax=Dendrobium chrysotoxum TaxID=161865 RepID=A0AAV7H9C3_DENCH|nr:hypothetical protein IEQ34_005685 [Dendrobium chrysotoxum]